MCCQSPRAHLSKPTAQMKLFFCPCLGQPRWLRPAVPPSLGLTQLGPGADTHKGVTPGKSTPPCHAWLCRCLVYPCGVDAFQLWGPGLLSHVLWDTNPCFSTSSLPFSRPHCPFLNCMARVGGLSHSMMPGTEHGAKPCGGDTAKESAGAMMGNVHSSLGFWVVPAHTNPEYNWCTPPIHVPWGLPKAQGCWRCQPT